MDVIKVVHDYMERMLSSKAASGMKALLMDPETSGIVSLVMTQSSALMKEVYLFERIDNPKREALLHLKCIAFLRPTDENISLLSAELADPKFKEYHIFFSNIVSKRQLEELARADEHCIVMQVQEFYADYFAINPEFFTLYTPSPGMCVSEPGWDATRQRCADGLAALLLSMKRRPVVRYASGSELARVVASDLLKKMKQESELFDFRRTEPAPLLLILDRRDDPVTPLLFQWTYQAMVHEALGLVKNRIDFPPGSSTSKDAPKSMVLSCDSDPFFRDNMFSDYATIGENLKELVAQYARQSKKNEKLDTLDDIRSFLDRYPEFKKLGSNAANHQRVVELINRHVRAHKMLTPEYGEPEYDGKPQYEVLTSISVVEQNLACHSDSAVIALKNVQKVVADPGTPIEDKLHVAMLYILRYEKECDMSSLSQDLIAGGVPPEEISKLHKLQRYSSHANRAVDLFANATFWSRAAHSVKRGLKGVENVLVEHSPFLVNIVTDAIKGKLPESQFPVILESVPPTVKGTAGAAGIRPCEVMVFIVGGATFEEAYHIARLNNAQETGARIILGGTDILNTKIFLKNIESVDA